MQVGAAGKKLVEYYLKGRLNEMSQGAYYHKLPIVLAETGGEGGEGEGGGGAGGDSDRGGGDAEQAVRGGWMGREGWWGVTDTPETNKQEAWRGHAVMQDAEEEKLSEYGSRGEEVGAGGGKAEGGGAKRGKQNILVVVLVECVHCSHLDQVRGSSSKEEGGDGGSRKEDGGEGRASRSPAASLSAGVSRVLK